MQATRPEWLSLQAQFTSLMLSERVSWIQNELKALSHEIEAHTTSAPGALSFRLGKIQRYVEWTAPDLVPDRAEEAEILVNVGRFVTQLVLQRDAWECDAITTAIAKHIQSVAAIQSRV